MNAILRHVSRCMIAGIIAILPIGGMVLSVLWLEDMISESWLAKQNWYFPGFGLLAATVSIYLIGLAVSSFVGRWIWKLFDTLLKNLPGLGRLYETLKQILGYGEGEEAFFREVVFLPSPYGGGKELGLVTNRYDGGRLLVFLPGSPNPTDGRLIIVDEASVERSKMPVNAALKSLISAGTTAPPLD